MTVKRIIGIVAGLLAGAATLAAGPRYDLVPLPKTLVEAPGEFVLNSTTGLVVEDGSFQEIADDFRAQVALTTGFRLQGKNGPIVLRKVDGLGKEAYRLEVTPKGILIEATEVNGAFYGLQTVLQLLPAEIYGKTRAKGVKKWTVPCCTIEDEPAFWYRGTLFDSGRFFFPKEEIMKFIDLMAMHKQNMFHWHLTEDQGWRIQIDKYPRLTEVGAWRKETADTEQQLTMVFKQGWNAIAIIRSLIITHIHLAPEVGDPVESIAIASIPSEFSSNIAFDFVQQPILVNIKIACGRPIRFFNPYVFNQFKNRMLQCSYILQYRHSTLEILHCQIHQSIAIPIGESRIGSFAHIDHRLLKKRLSI